MQLDTAFENLPILMDIPIIKASEVDSDRPLGAGPYFFENSISGLQLRRRTNWWCESEDLAAAATSVSLTVAKSPARSATSSSLRTWTWWWPTPARFLCGLPGGF